MNIAPKTFVTVCKIADVSDSEVESSWLSIWENSISEFLDWMLTSLTLTSEQAEKVEILFGQIGKENHEKSIIELLKPVLDENQLSAVTDKFADIVTTNLDIFYTDLKSKMTMEQKQVLDSFIKSTNV